MTAEELVAETIQASVNSAELRKITAAMMKRECVDVYDVESELGVRAVDISERHRRSVFRGVAPGSRPWAVELEIIE